MKKVVNFFKDRNRVKDIILVMELIIIVILGAKCIKLEKQVTSYKDKENNTIVQKIQLPDIESLDGSNTTKQQSSTDTTMTKDVEMLGYFNDLEASVDNISTKDKAKKKFVEAADFVFYNGKIKGYTFSELKDSTKLKITEILMRIDEKIEKRFPGYKEDIKATSKKTYTDIKEKLTAWYLDTSVKACENVGSEVCEQAKADFASMKDSYGYTWGKMKEIFKYGKTSLKDWYEIYRQS